MKVFENIAEKISSAKSSFNEISAERKQTLEKFADNISGKVESGKEVNLIFICTHNSRRSIMAQIWAQTAAEHFEIPNVRCYSGGTEATAFNPRAVKAVRKAGFKVEQIGESANPLYHVYFSENEKPVKCFSKKYDDSFNPQKDFVAVMTCSDADANCPVVFGAEARFSLPYNDPKEFDGSESEEAKYDERFEEIGTEIVFVFYRVKEKINIERK